MIGAVIGTGETLTRPAPLPGGDFPVDGVDEQVAKLSAGYPFLTPDWACRLVRAYGTEASEVLGNARDLPDLGEAFGATITARELDWSISNEWVRSGEDFLWRRTKLGLKLDDAQRAGVDAYIVERADADYSA